MSKKIRRSHPYMTCRFKEQFVDGDCLLEMKEEDLDVADFPKAKAFHWRKFWRLLQDAKTKGVNLQPTAAAAAPSSVASVAAPCLPTPADNVCAHDRFVGGFAAMDSTKNKDSLAPIHGLSHIPEVDLATALKQLKNECLRLNEPYPSKFAFLAGNIYVANAFVDKHWTTLAPKYAKRGLTKQRAAFINFYTHESPFYPVLNRLLREKDRHKLLPFKPFLKSFLSACYCLPLIPKSVKRGVKLNLKDRFDVGEEVTWWSITSATDNIGVLQSETFLGSKGPRTMFDITARSLVNIKELTTMEEDELVLLPGTILQVVAILDMDSKGDFVMIQLREKHPFIPMLDYVHPQLSESAAAGKAVPQPPPPPLAQSSAVVKPDPPGKMVRAEPSVELTHAKLVRNN